MQPSTKAHLALAGTNLFFAVNFSLVKHLMNQGLMQPFGLNLIRAAVASLLLWLLFFFNPVKEKIRSKDILRFILCALTGIALNQLLFLKGLSFTFATHASLLMLATPLLVMILASFILKEKLTGKKIIGLALGTIGATVLILNTPKAGEGSNVVFGDILIILNALSYAIYFILVKPLMAKYNNVLIIRMMFTIGTFMILPFGWTEFTNIPWSAFGAYDFAALFAIVFFGTFLAYLFNIYGIQILGASRAGSYIYLQPFLATLVAMFFLNEKLLPADIIAGGLIIFGVVLINWKKKE